MKTTTTMSIEELTTTLVQCGTIKQGDAIDIALQADIGTTALITFFAVVGVVILSIAISIVCE